MSVITGTAGHWSKGYEFRVEGTGGYSPEIPEAAFFLL